MLNSNLIQNVNVNINNSYDLTKKIFIYSLGSIILIIIFMITPLNNLFLISPLMKLLIIIILSYIFYLNLQQISNLKNITNDDNSSEISNQINTNIITGYIFSLFIGLLIIFVIRKLF